MKLRSWVLAATVVNHGDAGVGFRPPDWRLRSPAGEVRSSVAVGGGGLGAAQLTNGAQQSGSMCFETTYQPNGSPQRGVWLSTVD